MNGKPIEYEITAKAWQILKTYMNIDPYDDEDWSRCWAATEELYAMGEGTKADKYAKDTAIAVICHLERVSGASGGSEKK